MRTLTALSVSWSSRLLITAVWLFGFSMGVFAQIPNGSLAPDFTTIDVYGNPHSLSGYLNQGKTVILDFSSDACGPCWTYHKTGAMKDFYNAYGPPGSNEAMVLFIECGSANLAEMINQPPYYFGFGNWVEGSPYPMIIDHHIETDLYNLNYNPYLVKVCPNGIGSAIGTYPASALKNACNSCFQMNGVQNHVKLLDTKTSVCQSTGRLKAKFINYGTNAVQSATIKLFQNGNLIQTFSFAGSVAQFQTQQIEFDPIPLNPAASYTVALAQVNGASNRNPAFSSASLAFDVARPVSNTIELKVHTNFHPQQLSWNIKNSSQQIVASGGPYPNTATQPYLNTNKILSHMLTLPGNDCYSVELNSTGMGWQSSYYAQSAHPGIEILSGGNVVFEALDVGYFGSSLKFENLLSVGTLAIDDFAITSFSAYPNPACEKLYLNIPEGYSGTALVLATLTGEIIKRQSNNFSELDVSGLSTGLYLLMLEHESGREVIKFAKN